MRTLGLKDVEGRELVDRLMACESVGKFLCCRRGVPPSWKIYRVPR